MSHTRRSRLSAIAAAALVTCTGAALLPVCVDGAGAAVRTATVTPAAVDTTDRGAAPLGSTDYPIPAGALFVSPTGADTNAGTIDAPFATVAHALAVAKAGATIVLRGGTYHESVASRRLKIPLTIQNYPGETVWFDGSVPVDTWTQQGSTWVHDGWTAQFSSLPGYDAASAASIQWINPAYPMAAHPDELFVDGTQLQQVADASQVVPGTFAVDYTNHQLIMGSDPTGHEVRAADLSTAIDLEAPGSVLRGIGVRRYATAVPDKGAIRLGGSNQVMQNVLVTDIATQGVVLTGANQVIDHVTASNNGLGGLHGNLSDHLTVTNSVFDDNNTEHFNCSPVAAGVKLARSDYDTISNNLFQGNSSIGLWFDVSSYGMTITNNDMIGNERSGISLELSAGGLVANNTLAGNGFDGIRIFDTGHVRIWNNTMTGNAVRNLDIAQDNRVMTADNPNRDTRRAFPDPLGVDWTVNTIEVRDNLFVGTSAFHAYYQDVTGQSATARGISIDHNLFSAPPTKRWFPLGVRLGTSTTILKDTLAAWQAYSGQGADNVQSSGTTLDGMSADMASTAHAAPLPADIAAAASLPAGQQAWGRN